MVTKSTAGSPTPPLAVGDSLASDAPALHAMVTGRGRPVLLLHGLFGMGSNLGGVARSLADGFEVHQLDLPNHGRSAWTARMSLSDLANGVAAYQARATSEPAALLGHSLGGKTAMQLALQSPERVAALIVADIAPIAYPASHGRVFAGIEAVAADPPASRSDAAGLLRRHIEEDAVVQFLLLSLRRGSDKRYHWRFNAEALAANYDRLREAPDGGVYEGPTLFVYGQRSTYVDEKALAAARERFPAMRERMIAEAGHWLHAEQPELFNAAVRDFLDSVYAG